VAGAGRRSGAMSHEPLTRVGGPLCRTAGARRAG
jgi:hypothetical protein